MMRAFALGVLSLIWMAVAAAAEAASTDADWSYYGGDEGGERYSAAGQLLSIRHNNRRDCL